MGGGNQKQKQQMVFMRKQLQRKQTLHCQRIFQMQYKMILLRINMI